MLGGLNTGSTRVGNALRWLENRGRDPGRPPGTARRPGRARAARCPAPPSRSRGPWSEAAGAGPARVVRRAGRARRAGHAPPTRPRPIARRVGLPVALKVCSAQITHKSDIGGVALGLDSEARGPGRLREGARRGRGRARSAASTACSSRRCAPAGSSCSPGVTVDPTFGPVLAVGLGGVWVEILRDTSLRVLPVDRRRGQAHARRAARAAAAAGRARRAPADLDALAEAIARLGDAALSLDGALRALEVNPLWVNGDQVEALDVLVVTETEPSESMMLGTTAEQDELRASVRRFLTDRAPLTRVRELMESRGRNGPWRLGAGGRAARPAGPRHPRGVRRGRVLVRRAGDRA